MYELGLEYRYIAEYLQEKISKEEMCALIKTKSLQYAKRQMTWLKRGKIIVWIDQNNVEDIVRKIENFLV